jgi:predicted nucleotidyltransferase
VDLPRGYDLFTQRIPLAQAIGDLLRRKVDLIPEHEINPRLRTHILAEAVAI